MLTAQSKSNGMSPWHWTTLISSRPFYLPRELRECSSVWQHSRLAAMHTGSPGFHTWRTTACWNGKSFTTLSDTPPGKCVSLYREKSRDAGICWLQVPCTLGDSKSLISKQGLKTKLTSMCVLDFKPIAFKSVVMSREMYGIKSWH